MPLTDDGENGETERAATLANFLLPNYRTETAIDGLMKDIS